MRVLSNLVLVEPVRRVVLAKDLETVRIAWQILLRELHNLIAKFSSRLNVVPIEHESENRQFHSVQAVKQVVTLPR